MPADQIAQLTNKLSDSFQQALAAGSQGTTLAMVVSVIVMCLVILVAVRAISALVKTMLTVINNRDSELAAAIRDGNQAAREGNNGRTEQIGVLKTQGEAIQAQTTVLTDMHKKVNEIPVVAQVGFTAIKDVVASHETAAAQRSVTVVENQLDALQALERLETAAAKILAEITTTRLEILAALNPVVTPPKPEPVGET